MRLNLLVPSKTRLLAMAVLAVVSGWLLWPTGSGQAVTCLPPATAPTIQLIAPNGGQALEPGSSYDITWSATGASQVSLRLSTDNGETFPELIADGLNGAVYSWTVPDVFTETARIKAEAYDICGLLAAEAVSAESFILNGIPVPPDATTEISLTYPEDGRQVSGTLILEARTAEPVSSVDFRLLASGAAVAEKLPAISDLAGTGWSYSFKSHQMPNGDYRLWAEASGQELTTVKSEEIGIAVDNLVLPTIQSAMTKPTSGSGQSGIIQLEALTDIRADALDFVVRPKALDSSAETAVMYGLTSGAGKVWTANFDTRKFPDGAYYIKAKAYTLGQAVGESPEIEVLFDNPDTEAIAVYLSSPSAGSSLSGTVALVARTAVAVRSLDFVVTADATAGKDSEPIIIKATPDLEKKKWTALWDTLGAANDSYGLKAKVYQDGLLAGESPMSAVTVYNKPVLVGVNLISPAHNAQLTGSVRLEAHTGEAVEGLRFLVKPDDAPAQAPAHQLTAKSLADKSGWALDWDTSRELDGRYRLWAQAIYKERTVGESAVADIWLKNQAAAETISGALTAAETAAPAEDPNREGEYGSQSALRATPTISLNKGLAALEPEEEGSAYLFPPGSLIKTAAATAVYYYGRDGKRYVFPDSKTYYTWYGNFNNVRTISAAEMASVPIGGNVTYRPGTRMIKITSDPKVYAVSRGGLLRWVKNEVVARRLYGTSWNQMIDDVSDAYFVNYRIGPVIED